MSTINKVSSTFSEAGNVSIQKANLSEEMPASFKLPYWLQAPWFKTVKVGMCMLCFPLIYFIGKYLMELVK